MTRSESDANRALAERNIPSWQRPAPKRVVRKATLPQWLLNYLWRR